MSDRVFRIPTRTAWALLLVLVGTAFVLNYADNLQNERIPAGDGRRIFLYLEFVDALPYTPTNKVQKFELSDAGINEATWDLRKSDFEVQR